MGILISMYSYKILIIPQVEWANILVLSMCDGVSKHMFAVTR
jgi:hypothetical protein